MYIVETQRTAERRRAPKKHKAHQLLDRQRLQADLPPSRVDQHLAIGMAMERSATTRLKDSR